MIPGMGGGGHNQLDMIPVVRSIYSSGIKAINKQKTKSTERHHEETIIGLYDRNQEADRAPLVVEIMRASLGRYFAGI